MSARAPIRIQPLAPGGGLLNVTPRAVAALREALVAEGPETGLGVRLAVVGGGCSGLQYELEVDERRPTDTVVEAEGVPLLLDPKSAIYLKGTTLDYEDGLRGKGFSFSNPNASNTCGCGESFSV
jgi:iron-sulfur cluster assembly protein